MNAAHNIYRRESFVMMPTSVLEKLMEIKLTNECTRIVMYLVRFTMGYHREETRYSIQHIQRETGLPRTSIYRAIKTLENGNIVEKRNGMFRFLPIDGWGEGEKVCRTGATKVSHGRDKSVARARQTENDTLLLYKYKYNNKYIYSRDTAKAALHLVVSDNGRKKFSDGEVGMDKYGEIVDYLNQICGTSYRDKTPKTRKLIDSRIREGFSINDFRTVINNKARDWLNTDFEKYLRPETLFGTKFESYLNQKPHTALSRGERVVADMIHDTQDAEISAIKGFLS